MKMCCAHTHQCRLLLVAFERPFGKRTVCVECDKDGGDDEYILILYSKAVLENKSERHGYKIGAYSSSDNRLQTRPKPWQCSQNRWKTISNYLFRAKMGSDLLGWYGLSSNSNKAADSRSSRCLWPTTNRSIKGRHSTWKPFFSMYWLVEACWASALPNHRRKNIKSL